MGHEHGRVSINANRDGLDVHGKNHGCSGWADIDIVLAASLELGFVCIAVLASARYFYGA